MALDPFGSSVGWLGLLACCTCGRQRREMCCFPGALVEFCFLVFLKMWRRGSETRGCGQRSLFGPQQSKAQNRTQLWLYVSWFKVPRIWSRSCIRDNIFHVASKYVFMRRPLRVSSSQILIILSFPSVCSWFQQFHIFTFASDTCCVNVSECKIHDCEPRRLTHIFKRSRELLNIVFSEYVPLWRNPPLSNFDPFQTKERERETYSSCSFIFTSLAIGVNVFCGTSSWMCQVDSLQGSWCVELDLCWAFTDVRNWCSDLNSYRLRGRERFGADVLQSGALSFTSFSAALLMFDFFSDLERNQMSFCSSFWQVFCLETLILQETLVLQICGHKPRRCKHFCIQCLRTAPLW